MAELPAAVQATLKKGKGTDLEVSADGKVLERGKTHDESSEHEKK